jgi:hypothetical protein
LQQSEFWPLRPEDVGAVLEEIKGEPAAQETETGRPHLYIESPESPFPRVLAA